MAQGVVGGNSGTEQRRCFGVSQSLRYGHQRFYGSDHVLLITAVIADARNFQIPAIAKISTPALATGVVLAAVPADTYALSLVPRGNTSTHFIDDACDFMSWNAGILNSRPKPFFREHITVANTTSLYPNAHLSCVRFGNFALDNFEISAGFRNLRHHHWCCRWSDRYSERCHKSSYEFSAIVEKILTVTGEATGDFARRAFMPPPQRLLPAQPGYQAEGLQRHTPSGKGSCLFRRCFAATPKRRQRLSADRGHLPKSPPTHRAG